MTNPSFRPPTEDISQVTRPARVSIRVKPFAPILNHISFPVIATDPVNKVIGSEVDVGSLRLGPDEDGRRRSRVLSIHKQTGASP